jgi:hypothetical protein
VKTIAGKTLKEMETDRSGDFTVADLPAGVYEVSITKANYSTLNARMTAGGAAAARVLRAIKYGVISGHITSPRTGGTVVAIEKLKAPPAEVQSALRGNRRHAIEPKRNVRDHSIQKLRHRIGRSPAILFTRLANQP